MFWWFYRTTRQVLYIQRNNETRSCNHCCCGKAVCIKYSACVFILAFVTWQAKRMRRIILSVVACLTLPHFTAWPYKQHNIRRWGVGVGNLLSTNMCLIFSTTSVEKSLNVGRIQQDIIINIHKSPCKVPVILCRILTQLEFSRQIFEKSSNLKKICPVGANLWHADGQTDERTDGQGDRNDEGNSHLSQFCESA